MPKHLHFVEPYAGGLSVLLAKDPTGISEVANDIDKHLTNFWNVLRCPTAFLQFQRLCEATPFSEEVWNGIGPDVTTSLTSVDHAWRFFVRCRQSLAGRMKDFATLSRRRVRRQMNEQASAWLTAVEGLPEVHERLKRVVILNRDALDVIRQQDGVDTCYYCDPPYVHSSRASTDVYAHEMSLDDHANLLKVLAGIKGEFLLSGYRCPLYDAWCERHAFKRHDFDLPNNAAGGETKRRMVESVWTNY